MRISRDRLGASFAAVALAAEAWLLRPAQDVPSRPEASPAARRRYPVVCVAGLAPRCGATTLAWGLAAALSARQPDGIAVLTGTPPRGRAGSRPAGRLAAELATAGGAPVQPVGSVVVRGAPDPVALAAAARDRAPLVLDAGLAREAVRAASVSDRVLLVAPPSVEPALPAVFARSLGCAEPRSSCVVIGGPEHEWTRRGVLVVPRSRTGARRVLRGVGARGRLGRALAGLASELQPLERAGGGAATT